MNLFQKRFPQQSLRSIDNLEIDAWYSKEFKGIFLKREKRSKKWLDFNLETSGLEQRILNYKKGDKLFFRYKWYSKLQMGTWNYNVKSKKEYPLQHWTTLNLLDNDLGDIKFVWEKSKFTEIQDFMVYDLVTGQSNQQYILDDILDWISSNSVNTGPNWACSQEISLRLINWLMFICFYKEELYKNNYPELKIIIQSIFDQILHVKENINFSKKAVRNNHAFSELLALYLVGNMFNHIDEVSKFKKIGHDGFIKEFKFQIFNDGSDNQYSLNYYRTKIQLTSIFINQVEDKNKFIQENKNKLEAMVNFFNAVIIDNGQVPNYGANDGSLYFKFNETKEISNFLPQVGAFVKLIKSSNFRFNNNKLFLDDYLWFENEELHLPQNTENSKDIQYFPDSGYLTVNRNNVFMFIRLGIHKFRPSQSDNTHIDLWKNGKAILLDSGTYSYNIPEVDKEKYDFNLSKFHNVLVINDDSQMKPLMNFILLDWTYVEDIKIEDNINQNEIRVSCQLSAYRYLNSKLKINRTFVLDYNNSTLNIIDELNSMKNIRTIKHNWITKNPKLITSIKSKSISKSLEVVSEEIEIADKYGSTIPAMRFNSVSSEKSIETQINF
ncbi:heparinase II/III domain-containing protein [Lacinutrix mariniflava]|uniref:heparinase II/III domain-containing protein n=1 Tax=Lacinutrix mariniflava TaxID=342955 RepID=UPI001379136B|nr:heparinase II/III family protein [Lacinutrix mariniflava]